MVDPIVTCGFDVDALRTVANSKGTSKMSLCTQWQRYSKATSVADYSKETSLNQWKNKSDAERLRFKHALSALSPAPLAAAPAQVQLVAHDAEPAALTAHSPANTLDEFHERYSSLVERLDCDWEARCAEAQRSNDIRNRMYTDICNLMQRGVFSSICKASNVLKSYAVSRNKLAKVHAELAKYVEEHQCPFGRSIAQFLQESPSQYVIGRFARGYLSESQKHDVSVHVTICALGNRTLSVSEVQRAMWKLYLVNRGLVAATDGVDWSRFEFYSKDMTHVYRDRLTWTRSETGSIKASGLLAGSANMRRSKLRGLKGDEAADCTPEVIRATFNAQASLLTEIGVTKDGVILKEEAHRVAWADEKGFSEQSTKMQSGVAPACIKNPSTQMSQGSMGHISVFPIVDLAGGVSAPYLCVKATLTDDAWNIIWPEATVRATKKGGFHAEWFTEAVILYAKEKRKTEAKEIMLNIDSGGGSLIHLSVEFTLACVQYSLRPFYFHPNTTRAVMLLDQDPNRTAEAEWNTARRQSSDQGLTVRRALPIIRALHPRAYCPRTIEKGGRKVGFEVGKPLRPDTVLVDRAPDVFRAICKDSVGEMQTPEGKALLTPPSGYKRAAAHTECSRCHASVPVSFKHCDRCGEPNASYEEASAILHGRSAAKRHKQADAKEVAAVVAAAPDDTVKQTKKFMGDLMASMRAKGSAPASAPPEQAVANAEPKPGAKDAEAAGAIADADKAPSSDSGTEEFDMDNPDDVVNIIQASFPGKEVTSLGCKNIAEFEKVARFFVDNLKKGVCKAKPLSELVRAKLLQTGDLKSKKARESRYKWWAKKRSERYWKKPPGKPKA